MRMQGFFPVCAVITCLQEPGIQSPNVENPITGDRQRELAEWRFVFSSPLMVCEWERPFMSLVNVSPTAGV